MFPRSSLLFRFQSTLPHGSDYKIPDYYLKLFISIHAPSRERQRVPRSFRRRNFYFNPRSLTGATLFGTVRAYITHISIHAPSRERQKYLHCLPSPILFQSTLPHGSDLHKRYINYHTFISIHAPSRERLIF